MRRLLLLWMAAALLVWLLWPPSESAVEAGAPDLAGGTPAGPAAPVAGDAGDTDPAGGERPALSSGPIERAEVAATATLRIRVTDAALRPAPGLLLWASDPEPWRLPALMPGIGEQPIQHDGELELQVPLGRWLWLRAMGGQGSAYRRLEPLLGDGECDLVLAGGGFRVHVLVLADHLSAPAGNATVRVFRQPEEGGSPEVVRQGVTDREGWTRFEDLPPVTAPYAVCAGDADPRATGRQVRRLFLQAGMAPKDVTCVLVHPASTRPVRVAVNASFLRRPGVHIALLLRRVDDGSGRPCPVTPFLTPGRSTYDVELPPGMYVAEVQPQGEVGFAGGAPVVEVGDGDNACALDLEGPPAWTLLELRGLRMQDRPFTVRLLPEGGVQMGDQEKTWIGPWRWHSFAHEVPVLAGSFRVAVARSNGVWMSREPVIPAVPRTVADLQPATTLEVRWHHPRPAEVLGTALSLDTALGPMAATLDLALVEDRPVARCRVFVPRGDVSVHWQGEEGGWQRQVEADRSYVLLEVPDSTR